ncbi:hypothetical protein RND71_009610 [Anisodus tanguticus]|uniref:RNase H type-1 domain-containing protein n=1 Tax=Anisodus tanguticus TaxID=243964 RepID=A0AAE1VS03_9SOLA|nr:hypothetical protein RND71_009610 [Anisodus tanguticus]
MDNPTEITLDARNIVTQLQNHSTAYNSLFTDCRYLLHQLHNLVIRHVYREQNMVADRLAVLGATMEGANLSILDDPPSFVLALLHDDQYGREQPRRFPSSIPTDAATSNLFCNPTPQGAPYNASSSNLGPQLIRRRRSQTAFNAPLHIGSSSSAHAPAHLQDPLSAVPEAKISSIEAAKDIDAAVEMAGDNPPIEANSVDDLEVPVKIIPKDMLLQYFRSVDVVSALSSHVSIHREMLKETNDSPVLATAYNDMALALNDLFILHKMAKDNHNKAVATLQHLGSLRQEKKQTFNEVNVERHLNVSQMNELQGHLSKLRAELERIQAGIKAITPAICALESTIKAQDSSRSSLFWQGPHLDNKIHELGTQQVVWELDQKEGSKRLAQLENEWTVWKNRLAQATPTLPATDILIDLQFEAIAASVTQVVVAEPLLDAEKGFPEEVGANEVVVVGAAKDEREIAAI